MYFKLCEVSSLCFTKCNRFSSLVCLFYGLKGTFEEPLHCSMSSGQMNIEPALGRHYDKTPSYLLYSRLNPKMCTFGKASPLGSYNSPPLRSGQITTSAAEKDVTLLPGHPGCDPFFFFYCVMMMVVNVVHTRRSVGGSVGLRQL